MTITANLRFLYTFWRSGLLCALPRDVFCDVFCWKPNTMTNRSFSMYRNASDIWFLRGMLDANVREWFLSRGLLMSMSRTYCTAWVLWFMIHSEYKHKTLEEKSIFKHPYNSVKLKSYKIVIYREKSVILSISKTKQDSFIH